MAKLAVVLTHFSDVHLPTALKSLVNQTMGDIAIFVVDDHSIGESWIESIEAIAIQHKVVIYASTKNVGTYRLKNKMIESIDSEYIAFQDSDDFSMPTRLQLQSEKLDKHKSLGLIGCSYYEFDNAGNVELHNRFRFLNLRHTLGLECLCLHPTWMVRRNIYDCLGGFDGTTRICGDDDFFYRALMITKAANVKNPLYYKRKHQNSLTQASATGFYSKLRLDYKCSMENRIASLKSMRSTSMIENIVAPSNNVDFNLIKLL